MTKNVIYIISFIIFTTQIQAQNQSVAALSHLSGTPPVRHYTKKDFNADPQFWMACEDDNGFMYFGNNDGVLIYDGERWQKLFLPNNSSVRCLNVDEQGRVYAGGYNEFGIIQQNDLGDFKYVSLIDSLQLSHENFENAWHIHPISNELIIRSFKELICVKNNKSTLLPAKNAFINSYTIHDTLLVQDKNEGIFYYNRPTNSLTKLINSSDYHHESIIAITREPVDNKLLLLSQSGTVYCYSPSNRQTITISKVLEGTDIAINAIRHGDNWLIGTLNSKIITFDISKERPIPNHKFTDIRREAIHNLYLNKSGNLWVITNNGLDFIKMTDPIKTIFDDASVYDISFYNNRLYIATNEAVHMAPIIQVSDSEVTCGNFTKLEGLEGQAWSLNKINDGLLINHDKGLYLIEKDKLSRIGQLEGAWKTIPTDQKDKYLVCTYNGIYLARTSKEAPLTIVRKINGFNESSRDIIASKSKNTYWVCHGYKGVFRIKMDDDYERVVSLEHFSDHDGLPSAYNINAHNWQDQIVFTTNNGIYTFAPDKKKFVPFAPLNNILGTEKNIRKIVTAGDTTWFIKDDALGFFNKQTEDIHMEAFAALTGSFNRGMELIVPSSDAQMLIGTRNGLYVFDHLMNDHRTQKQTFINTFRYSNDTSSFPLPVKGQNLTSLPNNTRAVRFEFSSPELMNQYNVSYSYQLKPVDNNWSEWNASPFVEYNHLPPGDYTFMVKSKSAVGGEGNTTTLQFHIQHQWYQTTFAMVLFILLGVLIIFYLSYLVKKKIAYEKEKTKQEEAKARKLLELEIEQLKLTKEKKSISMAKQKLEEDVIYQSKQLANYTMLLIKKREVFTEIRNALRDLLKQKRTEKDKQEIRKLVKTINMNMSNEKHMKVFEANFERIHGDFFKTLTEQYPDLTQRELRLCAFIKMNLSNKDISPLLNISIRGVESARYRLRKKLAIDHEENLVEFLQKSLYDTNIS